MYLRFTWSTLAVLVLTTLFVVVGAAPSLAQSSDPVPPTTTAANTPHSPPSSSTTDSSSPAAGNSTSASQASAAAAEPKKAGQTRGMVASLKFEGSSSADGQIMDLNSSTGYNFNKWFGVDFGVPFYFVRSSSTSATTGQKVSASGVGLGNLYTDARFNFENPVLNYGSTITGSAPTGSKEKGHSTGRFTYDWNNHFEHGFGRVTPFADAGLGNSVTDTRYFKRPFTTLGHVAHFEAGLGVDIWGPISVSASLYDVAPWGPQTVYSRVVHRSVGSLGGTPRPGRQYEQNAIVAGGPDLVRDNGYNASLDISPKSWLSFEIGYSHSVHLALNTISWGIGFNITDAFKRQPVH